MAIRWHIGCSGFHYKHWKECFYPAGLPQRLWFQYYATHFNTLELNVTFYRFPRLPQLKEWYDKSPPEFSFSVKAPKAITHYKKLIGCESFLGDFYGTVQEGLGEKADCILFQFPSNFRYTADHLDKIIVNLNPAFSNVVVFRHASWWNKEVFTRLSEADISFSGMSHPTLPEGIISNTPLLYYRMHGVPQLYQSPYTTQDLEEVAATIDKSGAKNAFIYFNNDIGGAAIENAKEMITLTQ